MRVYESTYVDFLCIIFNEIDKNNAENITTLIIQVKNIQYPQIVYRTPKSKRDKN